MMMMMMMVKLTCIIILISIIIHHHYHNHHHHHHYYRGLKNLVFPASDRLKLHEQKSFFHICFPSSPIASYSLTQRGDDDSDGDHAINYAVMATGVEEMMMMNASCSDDRGDDGCGNSYRTIAAIDLDTVTVVSNFFRSEKYQRNRR